MTLQKQFRKHSFFVNKLLLKNFRLKNSYLKKNDGFVMISIYSIRNLIDGSNGLVRLQHKSGTKFSTILFIYTIIYIFFLHMNSTFFSRTNTYLYYFPACNLN